MAKYKVDQFSSSIKDNGKGFDNLFVLVELLNQSGNPVTREYRIWSDVRFPDLNQLAGLLSHGFNKAKADSLSVEISEFAERMYLFLTLPEVNNGDQIQVSAVRL